MARALRETYMRWVSAIGSLRWRAAIAASIILRREDVNEIHSACGLRGLRVALSGIGQAGLNRPRVVRLLVLRERASGEVAQSDSSRVTWSGARGGKLHDSVVAAPTGHAVSRPDASHRVRLTSDWAIDINLDRVTRHLEVLLVNVSRKRARRVGTSKNAISAILAIHWTLPWLIASRAVEQVCERYRVSQSNFPNGAASV
jgi:hypothetical protein